MQVTIRAAIMLLLLPFPGLAQEAVAAVETAPTEDATAEPEPRPEPVLQSPRPRPLRFAMDAVRRGNWANAARLAARDGPAAAAVVEWHRLRAGLGTYAEAMAFLSEHPDWPGLEWLRRQAEAALKGVSPEDVVAFFGDTTPQTARGTLAYADAMVALGREAEAEKAVLDAWLTMELGPETEAEFLGAYPELLLSQAAARIDAMIWKKEGVQARRLFLLVDAQTRAVAEARLALLNGADDAEEQIEALPVEARDTPGLAFARFEQLRKSRNTADARALLLDQSASKAGLGDPASWARARHDLARQSLRAGEVDDAYTLSSKHGLTEGPRFAELEWLAGYIALRHMDQPVLAATHFERFSKAVFTPISLGRAGYWLGRAYEAAGNAEAARAAYTAGAMHQTSFYGLLAAERAGIGPDPMLTGAESFLDWRDAPFTRSSVFQAGVLLYGSGETQLAERFFLHLTETLDRDALGTLGAYFRDLGDAHLQVMLGKRAARFGYTLAGPYYALHPLHLEENPVPDELMLAIARRESEFDPVVVSGAGARGLMQLMPGTAREVAGKLGLGYNEARLTADPGYNARLGGSYLAELADRFDGNIVMMSAGYNAGPSRPRRWMSDYGDPRKGEIDIVDWIETIPFDETRNYVMRVAESLPVYRARMGRAPLPIPFSEELVGSTMLPTN